MKMSPLGEMRLTMRHGRDYGSEELPNWGDPGPTLEGIMAVHVTYMYRWVIYFKDHASADKAQRVTGWKFWDHNALEMEFEEDMLKIASINSPHLFGDWEFQSQWHEHWDER